MFQTPILICSPVESADNAREWHYRRAVLLGKAAELWAKEYGKTRVALVPQVVIQDSLGYLSGSITQELYIAASRGLIERLIKQHPGDIAMFVLLSPDGKVTDSMRFDLQVWFQGSKARCTAAIVLSWADLLSWLVDSCQKVLVAPDAQDLLREAEELTLPQERVMVSNHSRVITRAP